jgi:hypothetical protein
LSWYCEIQAASHSYAASKLAHAAALARAKSDYEFALARAKTDYELALAQAEIVGRRVAADDARRRRAWDRYFYLADNAFDAGSSSPQTRLEIGAGKEVSSMGGMGPP